MADDSLDVVQVAKRDSSLIPVPAITWRLDVTAGPRVLLLADVLCSHHPTAPRFRGSAPRTTRADEGHRSSWSVAHARPVATLGAPPASAGGVLSRPDAFPARGYGRFNSQSGESEILGVRVQHTRPATFAAHRSPSVRPTPPTCAGWHWATSSTREVPLGASSAVRKLNAALGSCRERDRRPARPARRPRLDRWRCRRAWRRHSWWRTSRPPCV